MLLPLALLLLPPAGRRALAPPAVRATMQARYTRGEDGGGTVDEQRVQELIARRGELRRMRNFKGADGVLDQLNAMGVSVWDQDRVWMVGSQPPPRRPTGQAKGGVSPRIFVTNVAYEVEWQQLRDHFAAAGHPVVFARINTDSRTGRPLGSGVVQFESAAQANEAMEQMSGTPLLGRRITCRADMHWRPAEEYEEGAPGPAAAEGERPAWAAKAWSRVAGTEDDGAAAAGLDEERVLSLLERRDAARAVRRFAAADELLNELAEMGISLDDGRRQKCWWLGMRADGRGGGAATRRGAADARRRSWYNDGTPERS